MFRYSDYSHKKEIVHKVRIPTQSKSRPQYCRNCNAKNKNSALVCVQCEITLKRPPLRKKMR